jgi:biopolymer transport protein ExbD
MSMNVGGRKGSMADINITPYIDILLVLLIIFMVIVPIKQMDLEVKVPQPSNPVTSPPPTDVIVVDIGEFGNIEINHQPTTIHQLGERLQEIYSGRRNRNLFIRAIPGLPYNDVVRIIDIAKGTHVVGDIGLITPEDNR